MVLYGIVRFSIVLHSIVCYCIRAPPKRERYYEIHPLHPQDIPSPSSSGEIADENGLSILNEYDISRGQ